MNNYRITLTKRAKDDIIDIGDYITYTLLEPNISINFIKGLKQSISQLKFFPYKFPLVQDDLLQNQGIRCMPYKNYYIFYEIFPIS
ncbi:MAG: type II toxin-antitoxin system RelE/ParE family toxin [Lachnospiraceae bacterium]|nr:type II toxin-antitoxin system RelE/ParE family toxin [Lachnospiraceae bacterium]